MNTLILRRVNIGQDAIAKKVGDQDVIEFSVAENRTYLNDKKEKVEATTWYKCSYWTNRLVMVDFLTKGKSVNVIGRLSASSYLNKNGAPAVDLRVTVSEIDLLDKKETENNTVPAPINEQGNNVESSDLPPTQGPDDDLPF